ncbi:tannase/feruloyl esterase family alpha/beta hydrolase [Caballeronia sp. M23-90]
MTTLQNGELAACDSLDGAADGIISNLGACTFVPSSLRCPGGADTGDNCLSDARSRL